LNQADKIRVMGRVPQKIGKTEADDELAAVDGDVSSNIMMSVES
jgi:hypothetical protein